MSKTLQFLRFNFRHSRLIPLRAQRAMWTIRKRLEAMPVLNHPCFKLHRGEGVKGYAFGIISGPTFSIQAVTHDLAHVVEFGARGYQSRGRYGSLRFALRTVKIGGRDYDEPLTDQATMRECRVFGIQYRIEQRLGVAQPLRQYLREHVHTLRLMPDWVSCGDKQKLRKEMVSALRGTSDSEIDLRLSNWFNSIKRSKRAQEYFQQQGHTSCD